MVFTAKLCCRLADEMPRRERSGFSPVAWSCSTPATFIRVLKQGVTADTSLAASCDRGKGIGRCGWRPLLRHALGMPLCAEQARSAALVVYAQRERPRPSSWPPPFIPHLDARFISGIQFYDVQAVSMLLLQGLEVCGSCRGAAGGEHGALGVICQELPHELQPHPSTGSLNEVRGRSLGPAGRLGLCREAADQGGSLVQAASQGQPRRHRDGAHVNEGHRARSMGLEALMVKTFSYIYCSPAGGGPYCAVGWTPHIERWKFCDEVPTW